MTDLCKLYQTQHKRANETLEKLLEYKKEIDSKLLINPVNSILHKELRTVNLEIKITLNEIEHTEYNIQECELENNNLN